VRIAESELQRVRIGARTWACFMGRRDGRSAWIQEGSIRTCEARLLGYPSSAVLQGAGAVRILFRRRHTDHVLGQLPSILVSSQAGEMDMQGIRAAYIMWCASLCCSTLNIVVVLVGYYNAT